MGNPFISQALVRERTRQLEGEATRYRQASAQVTTHLSAVRLFEACAKKELRAIAKTAKIANMVALSDMQVAIIARRQLAGLLADAPTFARKLLESTANVVRELDKKIV